MTADALRLVLALALLGALSLSLAIKSEGLLQVLAVWAVIGAVLLGAGVVAVEGFGILRGD